MHPMDFSFQSTNNDNNNTTVDFDTTNTNPTIGHNLRIYQLNIEGISERKCEFLAKQFNEESIDVANIQETHLPSEGNRSQVPGYTMVAYIHHTKFGVASYVKDDLLPYTQVLPNLNEFGIGIKVDDVTIVNVYKPPSKEFQDHVLPSIAKPCIVAGDFNSHNTIWGYDNNDRDGDRVLDWMTRERLSLVYDPNGPGTFRSRRWNRTFTPDLCFVSEDENGTILSTTRRILKGFPNSQHRPIVINVGLRIPMIRADKKSRWNPCKHSLHLISFWLRQTKRFLVNVIPRVCEFFLLEILK